MPLERCYYLQRRYQPFQSIQPDQPVSDWVTPKIEERIAGTVEKALEKKGQESGQTLEELLPDSLKGLLDRMGLLDPLRGTLERRAEDSVAATAKAIAAAVARELVETFAFAILYILIFVALVILLRLAALAINLVLRLPVLSGVNTLGGALLGLVWAVLLLFAAVWLMQRFNWVVTPELIRDSILLKFFAENNPIGLIAAL